VVGRATRELVGMGKGGTTTLKGFIDPLGNIWGC